MRRAFIAAAALVLLLGGLVIYGAWRLRQGPIGLAWLRPYVETSMRRAQPGTALTLGRLELWWDRERRRLELRAVDVRLRHGGSGDELALPVVVLHPRLRPLLRGRVELHHLTLLAPRLTLVRTEAGVTLLDTVGTPEEQPAAAPALTAPALLRALHELVAMVGTLEIRAGEIRVEDRPTARTWALRQVDATLAVAATHLTARADAQLHSGTLIAPLSLQATEREGGRIEVVAGVSKVLPTALLVDAAPAAPFTLPPALVDILGVITSPIAGEARFMLGAQGHLDGSVRVRARGDAFTITDARRGLDLHDGQLVLDVEVDPANEIMTIRKATVSFPDTAVKLDGALTTRGDDARLELRGSITRFPVAALRRYWLTSVAPDARRWVTENITAGAAKNIQANVAFMLGSTNRAERCDIAAAFDEVAVRFAPDMPPANALRGSVAVSKTSSVFTIERGRLDQLEIAGGTVRISPRAGPDPTRVDVDVNVRGPLAGAVAVLNHDPVALARSLQVAPEDVEGTVDANIRCRIPLAAGVETVPTFSGSARLDGAASRQPVHGWTIRAGQFDVRLADDTVEADGRAELAAIPTSVSVRYPLGESKPSSVRLQALLDPQAWAALGIDLGEAVSGTIPLSAMATSQKNAPWSIALDADLTAVGLAPPVAAFGKAAGQAGHASARVLLADGKTIRVDHFDIDAGGTVAQGSAERGPNGWDTLRAEVRIPRAGKSKSTATADLSAQRQATDYRVTLGCNDAGALVNFFVGGQAHGGTLAFNGTAIPGEASVNGRLDIHEVEFSQAPVLARLLTLGSLSGLKSTVLREGVRFEQMQADLDYQRGVVRMENGRAEGDAMTVLGSGSFDTHARQMDVDCRLIPSYYGLNTAPQKIPIIGALVAKATGEAVQIIDARVHGPFADPNVAVAPTSVLAPEIVKEPLRALETKVPKRRTAR